MITLAYVNFWEDPENDSYFTYFIREHFNEVKLVKPTDNPDILICSVFDSGKYSIQNLQTKCKIFYYGENLDRFPPYNNDKYLYDTFDLIVGFKETNPDKKQIRFPLWLIYYPFYRWNDNNTNDSVNNIIAYIEDKHEKNKTKNKPFMTTILSRHDNNGQRTAIWKEIEKYGEVTSGGRFRNNYNKPVGNRLEDKISFISQSKYTICPENSRYEGYFTEKIFHALEAGTIPLYWAIDYPEREILNENKYCFCKIEVPHILSKKIKDAVENSEKYLEGKVFKENASEVIKEYYESLANGIREVLQRNSDIMEMEMHNRLTQIAINDIKQEIRNNNIKCITYISGEFTPRINNFKTQIEKADIFNYYKCYGYNDLGDDFKERFTDCFKYVKGGGFYIWKAYIIYEELKKMNDGDLLLYLDAGCTLNINEKSLKRFNEYVEMVKKNDKGLLRFKLDVHLEKDWTNFEVFKYFKKKFNLSNEKIMEIGNKEQIITGIMFIKKCDFTINFFERTLEILNNDYNLFTENYNRNGQQNRHDQSIMSLLYRVMDGDLILNDETWFIEGFDSERASGCPIWATRLRF